MAHYRIYQINTRGRIVNGTDCECTSDQEACAIAVDLLEAGVQGEVWERSRFVARVKAPARSTGLRDAAYFGLDHGTVSAVLQ